MPGSRRVPDVTGRDGSARPGRRVRELEWSALAGPFRPDVGSRMETRLPAPWRGSVHRYRGTGPSDADALDMGDFDVRPATGADVSPVESHAVVHGDCLEAGRELADVLRGSVRCVYIDPPYNRPRSHGSFTGTTEFSYRNRFAHDEWLDMMRGRLSVCRDLLAPDGVLVCAIDRYEQPRLTLLLEEMFPDRNVDCIVVVHNPRGTQGTNFSYSHEFSIFVTPRGIRTIGRRPIPESDVRWMSLMKHGNASLRETSRRCFYPILVSEDGIVGFGDVCDPDFHPASQVEVHGDVSHVYPIDSDGIERKWRYARDTVEGIRDRLRAVRRLEGRMDVLLGKNRGMYKTVWVDPRFDASPHGSRLLHSLVPGTDFSYPKSVYTVEECLRAVVGDDPDALVVDLFAGSGTTGHAVMDLNAADGGRRRFVLVEREPYAETVALTRVLRVAELLGDPTPIAYLEAGGAS